MAAAAVVLRLRPMQVSIPLARAQLVKATTVELVAGSLEVHTPQVVAVVLLLRVETQRQTLCLAAAALDHLVTLRGAQPPQRARTYRGLTGLLVAVEVPTTTTQALLVQAEVVAAAAESTAERAMPGPQTLAAVAAQTVPLAVRAL